MIITPTLLTDGYKIDHRRQYVPQTKTVVSNCTPRKSRIVGVEDVVVYGIQHYTIDALIEIWNEQFFKVPFKKIGEEFFEEMREYTLSDEAAKDIGIEHWRALHKLGYLPISVWALPEGTLCPIRVPYFVLYNTHPDFYWLPNFIETDMSAECWGPLTSATKALTYRKIFNKWAEKTGGDKSFIPFQGHDFSYRGMFGRQAAMLSGAGHLTSFVGTDTIPAIKWLKKYYQADSKKGIIGCSVFATEHAVMCTDTGFYILKNKLTWERYGEAEFEVFKRLITELYPNGYVSIVSDTWNLWKVLIDYLPRLKNEILARNGKVIIRPDSGDPADIICGTNPEFGYLGKEDISQNKGVIELLWDIFGGTINEQGYKVLDPHIGAIYGDSITTERADNICERLADKKFCSTNWVAGIGSYTYQCTTRDTYGIAQKATYAEIEIDNQLIGIPIFKDPITDDGTKKSAKGIVAVFKDENGKLYLKDMATWEELKNCEFKLVFENSKLYNLQSIHEIRDRITSSLT